MRKSLRQIVALLLLGGAIGAQVTLNVGPLTASGIGARHIVRDAQGRLFALLNDELAGGTRPLLLLLSTDGGASWNPLPFTFNDASSGLNSPNTTNWCSMAIDDQGALHATWAGYYYPTYYQQYYRRYDPNSGAASAIVNVGALAGATSGISTAAMSIALDQANTVWLVGQGPVGWQERLLRSTLPYAQGGTFTDLGGISPSASAQNTRICVDSQGLVHCSYYRNLAPGQYEHRIYDPVAGWQNPSTLGNGAIAPHDYYGVLVADSLGNVHSLVGVDTGTPAATWSFDYRRWDAANGWGTPVVVSTATPAQYTNVANYYIMDLACNEATGRVYAAYRDLANGGMLRISEKGLTETSFSVFTDLTPPSMGLHAYYQPVFRGSLHPISNNTGTDLDLTWQLRPTTSPPFQVIFQRLSLGGPSASLSLAGPPLLGTSPTLNLASASDPNGGYACALSGGSVPGIPLGDGRTIPLNYDALLLFTLPLNNGILFNNIGFLDTNGMATVVLSIPNLPFISGATVYAGFVVGDPQSLTGIGTISPALAITLQ